MSKISKFNIVEEDMIFYNEGIMALTISESYLENIFAEYNSLNDFLCRLGLFANAQICSAYENNRCRLVKRKSSPDGWYWVCRRPCTVSKSIRMNSFFESSKLKMKIL
ncbi:hypothetical protein DMUE_1941, partial [Dictyocoela muelleri]